MKLFVNTSALHILEESQSFATSLQLIPAATRRRLSSYAKTLLSAVLTIYEQFPQANKLPVILASRHGDLRRTIELLNDLVNGESLSPTQFCLSVNNAVLGQLSMITQNTQAMTTVGGGADSFAYAWLEGVTQLESHAQVLIIYADEQPPEPYTAQCESPRCGVAFAALLTKEPSPGAKQVNFAHSCHAEPSNTTDVVDVAQALHAALSSGEGTITMTNSNHHWSWHVAT